MIKKIYTDHSRPMRIVLFSSSGPGNTNTLLELQDLFPNLIQVVLVVVDRLGIPTLKIAQERGIPVISYEFEKLLLGVVDKEKEQEAIHAAILKDIKFFESQNGKIDLAILAYRRIIRGPLLDYFRDRMINQHPADLSIISILSRQRMYVGISGHRQSLIDGVGGARTSCFLVDEGIDTGLIVGQGCFVPFIGEPSDTSIFEHEQLQKQMSDKPLLQSVVYHIAMGNISIELSEGYPFESRLLFFGEYTGYCGLQLDSSFPSFGEIAEGDS